MPRGGGGGGGMRGGGFSGGGMRGGSFSSGGMRSSSFGGSSFRSGSSGSSFRSSSMGSSSSRPFGRTGATRTVSSGPSGPYHHSYQRPNNHYYGRHHYPYYGYYGYRPWYRRPWYSWWWWGGGYGGGYGYYRPWYYSPVYVGGGLVLTILLILIILPLIGIAIAVPFSGVSATGEVNYRSTETLYYNEYWYEYENIGAGNTITYSIQAQDYVNFAIANHPFEDFPLIDVVDPFSGTDTLENEGYGFYGYYLNGGSEIDYTVTSDMPLDVLVLDAENVLHWYNYEAYTYLAEFTNITSATGSEDIYYTDDYYLVWYNPYQTTAQVSWSVTFTAVDVIDLTSAPVAIINDNSMIGTFTVPTSGDWYFFVYFDPRYSFAESIDITFDVTYQTGQTSKVQWDAVRPKLITWVVIIGIIILIAAVARRAQKKATAQTPQTAETPGGAPQPQPTVQSSPPTITTIPTPKPYVAPPTYAPGTCARCGATIADEAQFCYSCGRKREGRQIGTPAIVTAPQSTNCSFCGALLDPMAHFCETCGTRINR